MKKTTLLVLISIFSMATNVFSQKLLTPNKTWAVFEEMLCGGETISFQVIDSTTIEGDTYYKIDNEFGYNFLLKEVGNKIYQRNETSDTDWLLYDFSLETSDTVTVYSCPNELNSITFTVDSVDTVVFAGMLRKRIFLSDT